MDLIVKINKLDLITKLLLLLIVIFLILITSDFIKKNFLIENFDSNNSIFQDFDNSTLFDNFYSNIYDKLHNDDNKNEIVINLIKKKL